jgi:hypothetical protein
VPSWHSPDPHSHLTVDHSPHCHQQRVPSHSHLPVRSLQYPPTPLPRLGHPVVLTFCACQLTPLPSTSEFARHERQRILFDDLNPRSLPCPPRFFVVASCALPLPPQASAYCQVCGEIGQPGRMLNGPVLQSCHKNQRQPSSQRECQHCTMKHKVSGKEYERMSMVCARPCLFSSSYDAFYENVNE